MLTPMRRPSKSDHSSRFLCLFLNIPVLVEAPGVGDLKEQVFFRKIENMQMNVHLHTTSSSFPFQFSRAHFMASEGKSPNWNTVHSFFKKQKAGDESTYYANEAD